MLDLDETIIHSWFKKIKNPDIYLDINIKTNRSPIYVMVRPGAYEFLEEMKKYYEIVIFTASVSSYAIPLISRLDKQNYQFQILFRQH